MKKTGICLLLAACALLFACAPKSPPEPAEDTPQVTDTASPEPTGEPAEDEFVFTRENFPRLDGSTSTQPLGQAIACVLLGEPREDVADLAVFRKTTQSYRNLLSGQCDLTIAAEPDAEVFDEMAEKGFEVEMVPVAMDALVFVVNGENPVDSLTIQELRQIYTGEITNWREVGGDDLEIDAFQRNKASGSQVLMEKLVMQGLEMTQPPQEYLIGEMEGLVQVVKRFDGSASAIGYTVYYYANDMQMADGLKILQIEGVTPNDETIAAGEYAFLNPYYLAMDKATPEDSPVRILFNWILSPEGQNLVKLENYVPAAGQTAGR